MRKPKEPTRPPDDAAQSERFLSTAKEQEADAEKVSFERVMRAIAPAKTGVKPRAKPKPKG
jgi:hypothetical protein